jgi:hypothetical protein
VPQLPFCAPLLCLLIWGGIYVWSHACSKAFVSDSILNSVQNDVGLAMRTLKPGRVPGRMINTSVFKHTMRKARTRLSLFRLGTCAARSNTVVLPPSYVGDLCLNVFFHILVCSGSVFNTCSDFYTGSVSRVFQSAALGFRRPSHCHESVHGCTHTAHAPLAEVIRNDHSAGYTEVRGDVKSAKRSATYCAMCIGAGVGAFFRSGVKSNFQC